MSPSLPSNAAHGASPIVMLALLTQLALLLCTNCGVSGVEQSVAVFSDGKYFRNVRTNPVTVEMHYNNSWEMVCVWKRQNSSERLSLAIYAPKQQGPRNCQFGTLSGPAVCAPSYVEFPTHTGTEVSNVTCTEVSNILVCSIRMEGFNPYHIGAWTCKSLTDNKNDTVILQYYKPLRKENVVMASWDPIGSSNGTANSTNRFECFTTTVVIPPAKLTFVLGGDELTMNGTRFPVQSLTEGTIYTAQPNEYTANATATNSTSKTPPRQDLSLAQQLLASNKILEIRLDRSLNGLILECVANQGLSDAHVPATQSRVLHLDHSSGRAAVAMPMISALPGGLHLWTATAVSILRRAVLH